MDTAHLSEWASNIVLFLFGSCLTQIDIYGYWKPFNTGMEYFILGPILLGWKTRIDIMIVKLNAFNGSEMKSA